MTDIYCCGCEKEVPAKLTTGAEIYPHRQDLKSLPFWICRKCYNYVGCHHKTKDRTRPLGNIPTRELRKARSHIHRILDPLWKRKGHDRKKIYSEIARGMGWQSYHTGDIKSVEEAREVYKIVKGIDNAKI